MSSSPASDASAAAGFTSSGPSFERFRLILAWAVFGISLIIYTLTVAPTTSFWDPGEFIAVSHGLQVNHPPGAPFYALVGRMVSMFVPLEHVALSINMISALASAFTVMLLYLVIIQLVREFRGPLERQSGFEQFGTLAGAVIGALTFAVSDTFWFNAVEAEVYAPSMFFTAIVVWMALKWAENLDKPHSDRWLLLISYMFGLALGVHLLNLLALFFVALIVYFENHRFELKSFLVMGGISIAGFLLIYPFTMFTIPDMIDDIGKVTFGLIGPLLYLSLICAAVAWGIWYTHKKGMRYANLAVISYAMILIGFSTYSLIFIRAQADPPINENDPSTPEAIVSFLKREQYGDTPLLRGYTYNNATGNVDRSREKLFPRRHSGQSHHMEYYARFDSDLAYFFSYQINHMYFRYLGWNFIGRDSDIQDAPVNTGFTDSRNRHNPAHTAYFFLPFILGVLGMTYHFLKDRRRAFSVLALFFLTGLAIVLYLNQSPYEPRERDYAYVGSFFAFSIWIGLGMTALIEWLGGPLRRKIAPAAGVFGITLLAVPFWMGLQNWDSHDRSGNYVARDYAYNLLNSLEPNAILFTNGDNDTFPLWYIQEVEGVRTDVRVVCLSLLNTDWYIKQMRDLFSHESRPLPISLNDLQVRQVTASLSMHEPSTIRIPVDKGLLERAFTDGDAPVEWTGVNTSTANFDHQVASAVPYSLPVEELDSEVSWFLQGRFAGTDGQGNRRHYLQTQDIMILDLLRNNQWLRPIYFANTVSRQSQLGLQNYFQFEGKAFRVVPKRRQAGNFGTMDPEVHEARLDAFEFQQWNDPDVYFDENIRRMLGNYRFAFSELADLRLRAGEKEKAAVWLNKGLEKIPFRREEDEVLTMSLFAYRLAVAGDSSSAYELARQAVEWKLEDLPYEFRELQKMDAMIAGLDEEVKKARAKARLERQRELTEELNTLREQSNKLYEGLGFSNSVMTILQRVFYMTGADDEAMDLALRANQISDGRMVLPESREANEAMVSRYNLGF